MSWLYSIVFAGLLLASGNDTVSTPQETKILPKLDVPVAVGDETERFEQTYPLNANGRVSISNVNGSITVDAWDRNEVKLVAVKTADSKERLADVEIKIDSTPEYLTVETNYDAWKNKNNGDRWREGCCKLQVDYQLTVPRGAVLNEIETVNGSVTVADFVNFTKISAVNGTVRASNLRGTANLSTVNGEVFADFDRLENGSRISLNTVNGRVNLIIPSDASATIKADSLNGSITNDFGLPVRKGQYVGRDLYGRVGSGEVQIKLNSVNGGLAISKKNDGKTISPSTNLLPQKAKDEENWKDHDNDNDNDNDNEVSINTTKISKDVSKAVKDSQKDIAIAIKQSQKEINRIQPEIARASADAARAAAEAVNSVEVQQQIRAGIERAAEVSARMAEADFRGMPRMEKKSKSFPVKGVPKVTIDAKGCGLKVRGWDKQEVQYTVTQFSNNRDRSPVKTTESYNDSSVNINIINGDKDSRDNYSNDLEARVSIEVFVPRKSNLKIVSDGEIRLEGVSGELEVMGSSESINIRNSNGKLSLSNTDGIARIIGFTGEISSVTNDGDIYLEGDFEKLTSKAGDGTVVLTLPQDANAILVSNTDVDDGGFKLLNEAKNTWRLGNGGRKYNFDFADGKLILRSMTDVAVN